MTAVRRSYYAPIDFDAMFVSKGRLECEAFYHVPRITIDAWLRERGKQRLIAERAEAVRRRGLLPMQAILDEAFPTDGKIDFTLARHAAQHLRIRRNGGYTVSPGPHGTWWIGTKRVTADELVAKAVREGFDPNLTGGVS